MLNIKNPETHRLAKELARRRGESLTAVVTHALRGELDRTPDVPAREIDAARVHAILEEMRSRLPRAFFDQEDPTADLYDPETGLPA